MTRDNRCMYMAHVLFVCCSDCVVVCVNVCCVAAIVKDSDFLSLGVCCCLCKVFNMLVRNASPIGPMCFRCLIFSLVRTLWVVIFTLFYCLLDLSCCECDVISLYFMCCSVNESVCLVCFVFDSVLLCFIAWYVLSWTVKEYRTLLSVGEKKRSTALSIFDQLFRLGSQFIKPYYKYIF